MTAKVEFDGELPFRAEFAEYMVASAIPKDAVKFVPQTLSEQAQEQARKNIGAMPAGVQPSVGISTSGVDKEGVSLQTESRESGAVALQHYAGGIATAAEHLTVLGNIANGERDTDAASVGQVKAIVKENALPHISGGTASNPIPFRSLESGAYILQGYFLFREDFGIANLTAPSLVVVDKNDDRKTDDAERNSQVFCFVANNNIVKHIRIPKLTKYPVESTIIELGKLETSKNRVTAVDSTSDNQHYPTAKAVYDAIMDAIDDIEPGTNSGTVAPSDEKYFEIYDYGLVSLKAEYRADGAKNAELPETIIIPDVINGTAVTALQDSMFESNNRVKSITIPGLVTTIPLKFANKAENLTEIKGTENVEVICQAAFQMCGIKKALFPNLKTFNGAAQFNTSPNLAIVDIGNAVTNIPQGCFLRCESLSAIRGGASVTAVDYRGMAGLWSLLTAPFIANLTSIGKEGFLYSRVNYDWWSLEESGQCTSGDNATPARWNPSDWWTTCTPTACENPLGSAFHQANPEWASRQIPNSSDTYGTGCLETSTAHIYSALKGVELSSPVEFVEVVVGGIDNGRLLTPTGTEYGEPAYNFADMQKWLAALDLNAEVLDGGWNSENLQKAYDALAEGALVLTYINPGHAGVIYGVTSNGEVMVLESSSYQKELRNFVAVRHRMKICNLTIKDAPVMIVKKG